MYILEMKNTTSKIKNSLDEFNSKPDIAEDRNNAVENKLIKCIQTKVHREKKNGNKEHKIYVK